MMKNELTRRSFLKYCGIGTAGVVSALALAGCAENDEDSNNGGVDDAPVNTPSTGKDFVATDTVDSTTPHATHMVDEINVTCSNATFDLSPFGGESGTRSWAYTLLWDKLACRPFKGALLDEMQMQIAKKVNKIDDYTYQCELYDYVQDSKGNHIDADDVVWSFEYSQSISRYACLNTYLEYIKKVDEYTVELKLKSLIVGAIEQCLTAVTICSQKWFESASAEELTNNPATTGAYVITSLTSGNSFTLEANEDYWQSDESLRSYLDSQNVKKVNYTIVSEASMRAIALENGESDWAQLNTNDLERFYKDGKAVDGYNVFLYSNSMFNFMLYNTDPSRPTSDQKLRQAIAYAIDPEQLLLASGYTMDYGYLAHDFVGAEQGDYNDAWDDEDYYGYDLEKAKQCIAESAYPDGCTITLMAASNSSNGPNVALQSMLAEIGITVEIQSYELALFNQYCYEVDKWDLTLRSGSPADTTPSAWAKYFDNTAYEIGTATFTKDDELQRLLVDAQTVHDAASIDAFHYYLKEQCYGLGLYVTFKNLVTQKGILSYGELYEGNPVINNVTFAEDYETAVK